MSDPLLRVADDHRPQTLAGPPVPVLTGFTTRVSSGGVGLDISTNGTLVYAAGDPLKQRLVWLDATGHSEDFGARRSQYSYQLRFSPDCQRLGVPSAEQGSVDVWVYEWPRDAWTRLTSSPDVDSFPAWSPDGAHIAFTSGLGILWAVKLRCAMSRLSLADIDELARLQRKIVSCSALIDPLLEREKFRKPDESLDWNIGISSRFSAGRFSLRFALVCFLFWQRRVPVLVFGSRLWRERLTFTHLLAAFRRNILIVVARRRRLSHG